MKLIAVLSALVLVVFAVPTPDEAAMTATVAKAKESHRDSSKNGHPTLTTVRAELFHKVYERSEGVSSVQLNVALAEPLSTVERVNSPLPATSEIQSTLKGYTSTAFSQRKLQREELEEDFLKQAKSNSAASEQKEWRTVIRAGLTGELCTSSNDCQGDRVCRDGNYQVCTSSSVQCICIPPLPIKCTSDADCPDGEECVDLEGVNVCVSEALDIGNPSTTEEPSISSPPISSGGSGLTLDLCRSSSDCQGDRVCKDADDQVCTCSSLECRCVPLEPIVCTSDADCPDGEECVDLASVNQDVCVSEALGINDPPTTSAPSTSSPPSSSGGSGLTGESCSSSSDCQGDRTCRDKDKQICSSSSAQCICFPPKPIICTSDADCPDGEECVDVEGVKQDVCVSKALGNGSPPSTGAPSTSAAGSSTVPDTTGGQNTPTPSPPQGSSSTDDDPVCVDARALSHLSQKELVFRQHTMANVLCDASESCATPGHIVRYKGAAMMMSSYCAIVGCTKQRILVNSPSYRRGIRVPSSTKDLEFTAFAARYNTRAEEVFLKAAVHIGL